MFHQMLFALQGKTGSIIKSYQQQISIDPSINYLDRGEIQIINQICKCGYYYKKISDMINKQTRESDRILDNDHFGSINNTKSLYRMAMYRSLQNILAEYTQLLSSIQLRFLQSHHFTLANLKAQLQPFYFILKQLSSTIQSIYDQNLKGGLVLNFLYHKYYNSNIILQRYLKQIMNDVIKVFINQVNMWILYGQIQDQYQQYFVHHVIKEDNDKYKLIGNHNKNIYNINNNSSTSSSSKHIQIPTWDMFTLQQPLIPTCLIQTQTACKILFIGKIIKILRTANKLSTLPQTFILQKINTTILSISQQYNQVIYESMIEEIRKIIATKIIQFIMKQQNLIQELQRLNDYFLMFNGQFFHHFIQQSKILQKVKLKQKAQKKINQVILPNTLLKLNQQKMIKKISYQLKPLGFSFTTFKYVSELWPVGNIDIVEGKGVRFNNKGTALWNRNKQVMDQHWTMRYEVKFSKNYSQFYNSNSNMNNIKNINLNQSSLNTQLIFIIQNNLQISSSTAHPPSYLSRIPQYISIKIGYQVLSQASPISYFSILYKDIKRNQKQIQILKTYPKGLNWLDQKKYEVKINYFKDVLKVDIKQDDKFQFPEIKTTIKVGNYLDLEMGRAYLGFIANINTNINNLSNNNVGNHNNVGNIHMNSNSNKNNNSMNNNSPQHSPSQISPQQSSCIQLIQWQLLSKSSAFNPSLWTDLNLNFKVQWPINLIITPDLLQSYNRLHKFLFPLRKIQIQLQQIFIRIPRYIKQIICLIKKQDLEKKNQINNQDKYKKQKQNGQEEYKQNWGYSEWLRQMS